ncbi:hypothetical protein PI124_g10916 [Phytophthora idaei]|nr:hypothetical protein PI125_g10503 [Phytophthora idaei]KAG3153721.1 hypothetical protein PI126_g9945 [Phytophthora idaei]KAG3244305.1 hypothetical protein PI124_g10916 [Phytophthora idaei]
MRAAPRSKAGPQTPSALYEEGCGSGYHRGLETMPESGGLA